MGSPLTTNVRSDELVALKVKLAELQRQNAEHGRRNTKLERQNAALRWEAAQRGHRGASDRTIGVMTPAAVPHFAGRGRRSLLAPVPTPAGEVCTTTAAHTPAYFCGMRCRHVIVTHTLLTCQLKCRHAVVSV